VRRNVPRKRFLFFISRFTFNEFAQFKIAKLILLEDSDRRKKRVFKIFTVN
jgi:hypothetical protein